MIKFVLIISKSDSKATKNVLSVRGNVYFFFEVVRTSVDQFTSKHISFSVYFQFQWDPYGLQFSFGARILIRTT